jgi:hypothetical protein
VSSTPTKYEHFHNITYNIRLDMENISDSLLFASCDNVFTDKLEFSLGGSVVQYKLERLYMYTGKIFAKSVCSVEHSESVCEFMYKHPDKLYAYYNELPISLKNNIVNNCSEFYAYYGFVKHDKSVDNADIISFATVNGMCKCHNAYKITETNLSVITHRLKSSHELLYRVGRCEVCNVLRTDYRVFFELYKTLKIKKSAQK